MFLKTQCEIVSNIAVMFSVNLDVYGNIFFNYNGSNPYFFKKPQFKDILYIHCFTIQKKNYMNPQGAKGRQSVNNDTLKKKHQTILEESTYIYSTG